MSYELDSRDLRFMRAAEWSDDLLASIDRGWEPPTPTTLESEQVWTDTYARALRDMAKSFPDPAGYAAMLDPIFAEAIMGATQGRNGGLWVDDNALVPALRSLGLIGIRDRELTCFAIKVRAELRKEERSPDG